MPMASRLYHAFHRRSPRLPDKYVSCLGRIGDEFRWVAGAPLRFFNRDSPPTHVLDRGDHLANGMATARAKINRSILVTLEHVPEGCNVRLGQVHYMRIVANCRVVRS